MLLSWAFRWYSTILYICIFCKATCWFKKYLAKWLFLSWTNQGPLKKNQIYIFFLHIQFFSMKIAWNLIQYCLVVDFRYFVANLTRWDFLKWPKIGYFWIRFSILEHHAVTTLRMVENGSPRLHITKNCW